LSGLQFIHPHASTTLLQAAGHTLPLSLFYRAFFFFFTVFYIDRTFARPTPGFENIQTLIPKINTFPFI